MRTASIRVRSSILAIVLLASASTALASPQSNSAALTETRPNEVLFGLTLNGPPDVNIHPQCDALALPCASPKTAPDPGVGIVGARNIGLHVAIAGEAGYYDNLWDSAASIQTTHREHNTVLSLTVGPRISTEFIPVSGRRRPYAFRVFGQVGVGFELNNLSPGGRIIRPGCGVDFKWMTGMILRFSLDDTLVRQGESRVGGPRAMLALGLGFD